MRWLQRACVVSVAAVVAVSLVVPASEARRRGNKHTPPYKAGPQGGDDWNHIDSDPRSGRMTIARAYPGPGGFGCPNSHAAWANFEVRHRIRNRKRPAKAVAVHYEEAEGDGYTWMTAKVKKRRKTLGFKAHQGPMAGESGKLLVKLYRRVHRGRLKIQFGLQVSSNCPQGEVSSVLFPRLKVRVARRR